MDFVNDQRHRKQHGLKSLGLYENGSRFEQRPVTQSTLATTFSGARDVLRTALESGDAERIGLAREFIIAIPLSPAKSGAERPDVAFAWVSRSKARDLLERIGRAERPVTHEVLDELPPGKVLAHLRSVLVATGALPPRDERLVALEKWITATVQARTDLAERRILHGYAVWHHMRRLRRRLGEDHTTRLQDLNVRCHVTAAKNFLDWLGGEGLAIGTCTQTDLERWMADPTVSYPDETGHFVRWSVQHRHARDLTYGTVRWTGPLSTIDSEKRWADARRLLNDDTLPTPDRVAGLLLILYAQKIATISQLTVGDVDFDGDTVSITLAPRRSSSPRRWLPWSASSSRPAAARPRSALRRTLPGSSPEVSRDVPSATTGSASASTRSGSGPSRTAPPRCSPSPPKCSPRSSPGCSGSTSKSPSSGSRHRAGTGPPTPPMSAAAHRQCQAASAVLEDIGSRRNERPQCRKDRDQ
ncbi:hypothetical protein ABZS86_33825 [Streptomyces sp. NPDC005355]|uniref:hypothetical protein n=1 Tax=Streptomyces sp. NPDC005355 TaxID=3157038 RepID=UPI0033AC81E4